jgi:putative salt-induced outer membrane protein YdiY
VKTQYAGEVSIDWGHVESISTSGPVELMLRDGEVPLRGTLQPLYGGGALLVSPEGEAAEVRLREIVLLNPKPYESGRGMHYAGRALVSAAYSRGNVDSDRVHVEADFTARAKAYRYGLSGRIERRTEADTGEHSAWLAGANYDRFLDDNEFAYLRASVEHDRAKDIDLRRTTGIGYGLQLLESPAARLALRGGLDHVAVDRITGASERYPAFGWGIQAAFSPWGPRVELFHEQDGFWNLEDTSVVVVRSKSGLRLPLVERLNVTAQINVDWERQPAPERESTDSTLLLGLDYSF